MCREGDLLLLADVAPVIHEGRPLLERMAFLTAWAYIVRVRSNVRLKASTRYASRGAAYPKERWSNSIRTIQQEGS